MLFEYLKDEDSIYMFEIKQAILDTSLVNYQEQPQKKITSDN